MTTTPRTNLGTLVTGAIVATVGFALLFDVLGFIEARNLFRFWPALLVVYGLVIIAQAVLGRDGGEAGDGQRPGSTSGVSSGLIWLLIIMAVVFTRGADWRSSRTESRSDAANLFAIMGGDGRVIRSSNFNGGTMVSVMGGTELDLRNATPGPDGEIDIDVFAVMGGAVIYVPKTWKVDVKTIPILGGVKDERFSEVRRPRRGGESDGPGGAAPSTDAPAPAVETQAGPAPRVVVRGVAFMGGLVIKS